MDSNTKIYVVDLNLLPYGSEEFKSSPEDEGFDITAFKKEAERQGNVYTPEGFEKAYNTEEIPYDTFIKIINN